MLHSALIKTSNLFEIFPSLPHILHIEYKNCQFWIQIRCILSKMLLLFLPFTWPRCIWHINHSIGAAQNSLLFWLAIFTWKVGPILTQLTFDTNPNQNSKMDNDKYMGRRIRLWAAIPSPVLHYFCQTKFENVFPNSISHISLTHTLY